MNAAERATNVELASKIAAIVNLIKSELPDIRVDLKPWTNDRDTRELIDPESIDLGFHFPGRSRLWQCQSILLQIRFHDDSIAGSHRAIGVEAAGFDYRGRQWQFSTIEQWRFTGTAPQPEMAEQFKQFCVQILELFNGSVEA